MPLAGEIIVAGQIPGERVATTIATANSAVITTTETVVMSVMAPVVNGRTYRVVFDAAYDGTVIDDTFLANMREDSLTGTSIQARRLSLASTPSLQPVHFGVEYTAIATADKTFVVTLVRTSGTGNVILNAAANFPAYLYVDYIRG